MCCDQLGLTQSTLVLFKFGSPYTGSCSAPSPSRLCPPSSNCISIQSYGSVSGVHPLLTDHMDLHTVVVCPTHHCSSTATASLEVSVTASLISRDHNSGILSLQIIFYECNRLIFLVYGQSIHILTWSCWFSFILIQRCTFSSKHTTHLINAKS